MDYSKLAYLKAEELQNSLLSKKQENIKATKVITTLKSTVKAHQKTAVANVLGSGSALAIIQVGFACEQQGEVTFYLDGRVLGHETILKNTVFTTGITVTADSVIYVQTDVDAEINKVATMVMGAGVSLSASKAYNLCTTENLIALASIDSGEITLSIYNKSDLLKSKDIMAGFAVELDIMPISFNNNPCFLIVYKELCGNLILAVCDGTGITERCLISTDQSPTSLTLSNIKNHIVLGYSIGNECYCSIINYDFTGEGSLINTVKVESGNSIRLIGDTPPLAVVTYKDNNYLRITENEINCDFVINASLTCPQQS